MEGEQLKVGFFMKLVCFFLPVVAWMLYAFHAATSPKAARKCMIISLLPTLLVLLATALYVFDTLI